MQKKAYLERGGVEKGDVSLETSARILDKRKKRVCGWVGVGAGEVFFLKRKGKNKEGF